MEGLNKTWFVDIDGTLFRHKTDEELKNMVLCGSYAEEEPIQEGIDFLRSLPEKDVIVITTARSSAFREHTINALARFGVPFDQIIFDIGSGPRVVVNDVKPAGVVGNEFDLSMAYSINVKRNSWGASDELRYVEENFKREFGC